MVFSRLLHFNCVYIRMFKFILLFTRFIQSNTQEPEEKFNKKFFFELHIHFIRY